MAEKNSLMLRISCAVPDSVAATGLGISLLMKVHLTGGIFIIKRRKYLRQT
jgi:hypothetical protein